MSLLSRITGRATAPIVERAKILPNRFLEGSAFQTMGAVTRTPRENTSSEIIKSITAYADIYENGAKSAEPKLIELASEYGINLKKEAKRLGVDIFQAAKRQGKVENDFKYRDIFGEEKTEHRVLDLAEVASDVEAQKHLGETNSRELRNFLAQTDGMTTEQLGVAHDIIDLAHMGSMLNTNISLQKIIKNGKSIMGDLLSKFPEVSRRNPGAIELTGKVFNHSDDSNSKYFLLNLFNTVKPVDNSNIFTIELKEEIKFEELVLLKQMLCNNSGSDPVMFKLTDLSGEVKILTSSMFWVNSSNDLVNTLKKGFGNRIEINIKSMDSDIKDEV